MYWNIFIWKELQSLQQKKNSESNYLQVEKTWNSGESCSLSKFFQEYINNPSRKLQKPKMKI